jgi:hypothetical protein
VLLIDGTSYGEMLAPPRRGRDERVDRAPPRTSVSAISGVSKSLRLSAETLAFLANRAPLPGAAEMRFLLFAVAVAPSL